MTTINNVNNCNTVLKQPGSFAETGVLDQKVFEQSYKMNPAHALFNCPVTSIKTAHYLETGTLPELNLSFPHRPRPTITEDLPKKEWAKPVFDGLAPNRGSVVLTCSRNSLEFVMRQLGPGTHAVIGANGKNSPGGHIWNYAYDGRKFTILDSYSKRHHKLGLENPNKFFAGYNEKSLEVILFYSRTPENDSTVSLLKKK